MKEQRLLSKPEEMENGVEKHAQQSTDDPPEREKLESAGDECESDEHLDSNTKIATGIEMIVDFDGIDDPYNAVSKLILKAWSKRENRLQRRNIQLPAPVFIATLQNQVAK
ncbi:MAG: hypothetical protein ALECFALPRED_001094 [Alectoria fallacina]|uniref:Uncharacterized protein n=1 Tax=Alectoria fallacina TaxID=1903189 RepID=A0A8H3IFV0_9LECA|nr:MAG: hypothetical protein ALECFALPRED_001094 [Alectoria fallacina]